MKYRAGIGVNVVVIALLGLMVLLASGFLIQTSSGDITETAVEQPDEANCDTWAEQSMTASDPDEEDVYEERYNENCDGTLADRRGEEESFFESDYNPEEHESDEYFDWASDSGGATTVGEGESVEIDQLQGSVDYVGRSEGTVSERVYLRYAPDGDMSSITGSATGDVNCKAENNIISGLPVDELPNDVNECAYTAVGDTMVGQVKFAICSFTSNGVEIAVGQPNERGVDICREYASIEVDEIS